MAKPTKIERVETILWDRWLLVRIYCEDGTVGIGEGGVHGWQRPTQTMVEVMAPYLLGKDPHRIEHHYQFLYRSSHFMGAVVQGALSALDIALWDIKGKRLGVPIYDLLGGKTRSKVRCYIHVRGDTTEQAGAGRGGESQAGLHCRALCALGAETFTCTSRTRSGPRRRCDASARCGRQWVQTWTSASSCTDR